MVRFLAALLCLIFTASGDVRVGQPAPEIALDQLLPEQPAANASLAALKGKAVVLEFWATWCGPCVMAIPHLNELTVQFKEQPVVFLSVTDESSAAVETFLKRRPIEGWIGLARDRKTFADYGVAGVPRTFLIDAAGKLVASVTPNDLTAGLIDDLIAKRPISVPMTVPGSSAFRPSDDPLARPLFDVMIRPTTTLDRSGPVGRAKDSLILKAVTLRGLLGGVYLFPASRITSNAMDENTRYDVWISLPGASLEAFQQVSCDVVRATFDLSVRKETRETDVYVLTAPNGKPPGLVKAEDDGRFTMFGRKGSLSLKGTFGGLGLMMEPLLGKPVVDETGIEGVFNIKVTYRDGVPGSLEEAVRALGLKIEPARRLVEFLAVSKSQ
ncbi:MAG TPA: TIGR03435 family protein [Candidatus Sulfopaludibacter sp.]|jgi:uncharacterized protein (TIGR03435 family)|nr:TIGR03435 family protein [Candidatus Sulfopaludibacter sp.]